MVTQMTRLGRRIRHRRTWAFMGLAGTIVVVLVLVLVDPRPGPRPARSRAPDDLPYFLAHRDALSDAPEELRRAFSVRLASWETSTPIGESRAPRWFVVLENAHPDRRLHIADVIVEPTPATAPGIRIIHEGFSTATLDPGESRQVELVTPTEPAPERSPPPSPDPEDYGVRISVVAGFAEASGLPSPLPTPADTEAFRDAWGEFALVETFSTIPPDLLRLSPPS